MAAGAIEAVVAEALAVGKVAGTALWAAAVADSDLAVDSTPVMAAAMRAPAVVAMGAMVAMGRAAQLAAPRGCPGATVCEVRRGSAGAAAAGVVAVVPGPQAAKAATSWSHRMASPKRGPLG